MDKNIYLKSLYDGLTIYFRNKIGNAMDESIVLYKGSPLKGVKVTVYHYNLPPVVPVELGEVRKYFIDAINTVVEEWRKNDFNVTTEIYEDECIVYWSARL